MCFSPQEVLGEIQVLLSGCGEGVEVPGAGAEDGEGQWLCRVGRSSLLLGRKMSKKADAFMGLEAGTTSQRKYNAIG